MACAGSVPAKDNEKHHDTRANGQRCICAGSKGSHSQSQRRGRKALQRQDPAELCKPAAATNPPASVTSCASRACIHTVTKITHIKDCRRRMPRRSTWRALGGGLLLGRRWRRTAAGRRLRWATQRPAWTGSRARRRSCSWPARAARWCAPWGTRSGTSPGCSWPR